MTESTPPQPALALPRLLIVDDEPGNILVMAKALEDRYETQFATSGPQALELVAGGAPDLILLDMLMPGMDGMAVLDALRQQPQTRRIPVIFVTARSDPASETRALRAGAADFIAKPINSDILRLRVQLHLALSAQERNLELMATELAEAQALAHLGSWHSNHPGPDMPVSCSAETGRILGCDPLDLHRFGDLLDRITEPIDRSQVEHAWRDALRGLRFDITHRVRGPAGAQRWVRHRARIDFNTQGTPVRALGTLHDITTLKVQELRLEQLASIDALTGVANRRRLDERLNESFLQMRRSGRTFTLIMLDIDHFKQINDEHGHPAGDGVLTQLARLLAQGCRATDLVARFGGEEFVVLVPEPRDAEEGPHLAERLRRAVEAASFGTLGHITISLGVSESHPDDADEHAVLARADHAMYEAKSLGRNRTITHP